MANYSQTSKTQKPVRTVKPEPPAKRREVTLARSPVRRSTSKQAVDSFGVTAEPGTSSRTDTDYDGGIAWDLIDPDSIGLAKPLATQKVMAHFEKVQPGRSVPLDIDDADLDIFDI